MLLAPLAARADQPPSTPAQSSVHVVQAGETLSQIALDAGVDTATLAALNTLDDANVLSIGQPLKLPTAGDNATNAVPTAPSVPTTYTVGAGDTLWDIAHRVGATTDSLVQLNKLDDADHLVVGAVLTLPTTSGPADTYAAPAAPAPAATAAVPPPATAATAASPTGRRSLLVSYTVQAGETLTQIARQFDVSSGAIAQASTLDDPNKLSIGSVLKVPVPAKEHVVVAGETLRDIAAAEKVDLGSLIDFNTQLEDPALIRVGQIVLLPIAAGGQTAAAAPATQPAAANPPPPAPPAPTPTPRPMAPASQPAAVKPAAPDPAAQQAAVKPAAAAQAAQQAAAKPATQPPSAPKPAAPLVVVAPPPGAPSDGLAGAGLKLLGAPYVWGGSSPSGFDCSGFVWYVARQLNKQLRRGMFAQYSSGAHPGRDELKPGDLVFFQNTFAPGLSHNGIYIGNRQFVHAADEAAGVTISSMDTPYWSSHWFGATRLP
jgi:cell wall-associated NlpC family hydrolase